MIFSRSFLQTAATLGQASALALMISCESQSDSNDDLLLLSLIPPPELETVEFVDLERYAGTWYEVASLPQPFNGGCACTSATYGALDPGVISVTNICTEGSPSGAERRIDGRAFVVPDTGNAVLSVEFFFPFRGPYYIIDLDTTNYEYATVGDPFRGSLFLLSRDRAPAQSQTDAQISRAAELEFPVEALRTIEQTGCP